MQAAVSAEFAKEKGWKTAALLFDEAMDYTKFLAKYFKDRFTMEDIGGQIVSEQTYSMGDTDFSAQLTDFKNLDPQPDFLFVSSNPGEIGTIIKQARDLGLDHADRRWRRLRHATAGPVAGNEAANNVFFTTHQGIYGDDPAAAAFAKAYEAEYGNPPEAVFAALGYDGIKLMADAMTRAGTIDGAAVRDALAATQGFQGVTGTISYEPGAAFPRSLWHLIEVVDGKNHSAEDRDAGVVPPA